MSQNYHCWACTALLAAYLTLPALDVQGHTSSSLTPFEANETMNMVSWSKTSPETFSSPWRNASEMDASTLCADPEACNYDPTAPSDPPVTSECTYPDPGYDCAGDCLADADGDGICDEFEGLACHDEAACNFEAYTGGSEVCLQIEAIAEHAGEPGLEALTGYTTYNVYALCPNADDFVSSVSGDSDFPTLASGDAPFYQSEFGGAFGQNLQSGLFGVLPAEEFDSFLTIGLTGSAQPGEGSVNSIDSPDNPWVENFENDGVLAIDDAIGGAWFIFNGNTNGIAGDDYRVLLGQFTTVGPLQGQMYVQVFLHGNPSDEVRTLLEFGSACYGPETSFGCEFPDPEYDCNGDCLTDTDGDGVCDAFETTGCTDGLACNFDSNATEEDGSCTYPAAGYNCDGSCAADADGDGICDEFEIFGCTDATSFNFDASATEDDGTCLPPACLDDAACNFDGSMEAPASPCLAIETYAIHTGMVGDADLTGFTTYRIYATLPNPTDFVSSVSGDSEFPTQVSSTTGFYQDPIGQGIGSDIQTSLFGFIPALAYDSWVTIGLEGAPAGDQGAVNSITSNEVDWVANFENGGNLDISDAIGGGWYVLNGNSNGIAGEDHRVLLGQFTTDGQISGTMYLQIFNNGSPADEIRMSVNIEDACMAFNNDLCEYPAEPYLDCNGDCLNDADGDGICDELESAGCTDTLACNYDAEATDDNGSCTYATAEVDCDGNCLNDADGDGVCDESELAGCTDSTASNFEPWATDDDGSCIEPACNDAAACNYTPWGGANGLCLAIETVAVHEGMIEGPVNSVDLSGMATYRIYAVLDNADDFVSSVAGDSDFPTNINTTTNFFQAAEGVGLGSELMPSLFAFFPDVAYDSWVTIGREGLAGPGEGSVSTISAEGFDWLADFEEGNNLAIEDEIGGAWYILGDNAAGIAGDDHQVLLGQFTTSGVLSGQLYIQIFVNGDPNQVVRETIDLSSPCVSIDYTDCVFPEEGLDCNGNCLNDADGDGVCDENEIAGCDDASACNFDATATDNDGSCNYADGACESCNPEGGVDLADADGDGVCDGDEIAGCQDANACNYDASATDEDGSCLFADGNCEVCNGDGGVDVLDADGDGICDDAEIGGCQDANACNYNAAATDEDGSCVYANGNCEVCDGNGGIAVQDADGDGVCDEDEILGCMVSFACNYDATATDDDGSCVFALAACEVCMNNGVVLLDADGDGVCDADEIAGCQDSEACNYNPAATDEDGSCIYADGNCEACDGNGGIAVLDNDGDGVCNADEISGCQDAEACNYNPSATDEDGSCVFADGNCEVCDGNGGVSLLDADGDGVCDGDEIAGCQDAEACNYDAEATDEDGSCIYADGNCEVCDGAGGINVLDADGDNVCDGDEIAGCQDMEACNYDATATDEDGSCEYPQVGYDCNGNCNSDIDNDGVCDEFEVAGCDDANALNFDPLATDNDGSCVFPVLTITATVCNASPSEVRLTGPWWGWDPLGGPIAADNGDGTWTFTFDPAPTDNMEYLLVVDGVQENLIQSMVDGGSCAPVTDYWSYANRLWEVGSGDVSGILYGTCDSDCPVLGCTDATACNFSSEATEDDGSCNYAVEGYDCNGDCLVDTDEDGVCDPFEIVGCTDAAACNYDPTATDDGNCEFPATGYDCSGVCLSDVDGDGVCDVNEVPGCMDQEACNYDAAATDEDGTCLYPENSGVDCNGDCLADADGDGICDPFEIAGCTQAGACNYSGLATDDDGSCTFPNCVYDCDGNCNNDADGDGICDELEGQNLAPICGPGTVWNEEMGYCEITSDPCWRFDSNLDGHIQLQDLMDFLEVYGTYCD